MCYEEFIAYQCGHRSMGVVRPCPMTTAGHNFPICGIPAHKPHYAETMCTPCERQLHSRWVLIREWEHRWLHERGVCGCEVIFPGLLTTPRVIGDTLVVGDADSTAGSASPTVAEDDKASHPRATTVAEGSKDTRSETSQGDVEKTTSAGGDGRIPALFAQGVTSTGEHHVAVRLPSLYAAEWKADHAALHHAGKCNCAATFTPYKPQIGDDELTPHDRDTLRQWRQRETAEQKVKHDTPDVDGQTDETANRIAEIKKAFGEFEVDDEAPKVKLARLPATSAADSQPARTRGQGNNNFRGSHFNRRSGTRNLPPRPQSQPTRPFTPATTRPFTPSGSQSQTQPQGQLVLASQHEPSPSPHAHAHSQIYTHPFIPAPTTTTTMGGMGMGYIPPEYREYPEYPDYPPNHHHHHGQHQPQPHYFPPAHPAYATPATYTDTIPFGAHPWAAEPQQAAPGMAWVAQGPGPYRTPGLVYSHHNNTAGAGVDGSGSRSWHKQEGHGQGHGHGQGYAHRRPPIVRGERRLPAIEYTSHTSRVNYTEDDANDDNEEEEHGNNGKGKAKGKWKWKEIDDHHHSHDQGQNTSTTTTTTRPLCGLPIGAGPEGTCHMPSWLDCPLRRSVSVGALMITGGEEGEEDVGGEEQEEEQEMVPVPEGELALEMVQEPEDQGLEESQEETKKETQEESREEGEKDGEGDDKQLTPPSPPPRRHSAAT